jgi:hypothetical protein
MMSANSPQIENFSERGYYRERCTKVGIASLWRARCTFVRDRTLHYPAMGKRQRDLDRPFFPLTGLNSHYTAVGFDDSLGLGKGHGGPALDPWRDTPSLSEGVEERSQAGGRNSAAVGS